MRSIIALGTGALLALAGEAAVGAQRTFVATTGSDANPCSPTQPCRGFGAALAHTDPGGEIVVLDSGGYGRVTIGKSVTIAAPAGVHAAISVFPGTNGIDIPADGVKVVLRGLAITGQGGTHGIYVSGQNELTIERCDIAGMTVNGVFMDNVAGTLQMRDTVVHDNSGMGIMLVGQLSASLDRVHVERNTLTGVYVIDGPKVDVKDSALIRNNRGLEITSTTAYTSLAADGLRAESNNQEGVRAVASASSLLLTLARSAISHNPYAGALVESTGGNADAAFSDNVFTDNGASIVVDKGVGNARTLLVRNVFVDATGVLIYNGAFFKSGGGNAIFPGGSISVPDQTSSF
jgi:hypothetical protein